MESVCLKCGSSGFSETLVFCKKCQACALHRYCLDGPVIFTDDVTWYCEDCETRLIVPSSNGQPGPLPSETSDSVSLANKAFEAGRELKNCTLRVKKSNQQQRKVTKKKTKKKGKVNSGLAVNKKALLSVNRCSPELEHPECNISREEESELKNKRGPVPRDAINSNVGSKSVPKCQVTTNGELNCIDEDCNVNAQPVIDPAWRGSLSFSNKNIGTVSGLLGHWSNLACPKVLEATALLPEVLNVEMLPKSRVWPKSFKDGQPTDKSIALYFFPENERAENVFDALVDDIIKDVLGIRVMTEKAELLIFPSILLPMQHRRFRAKYYLWGVFRAKKTSENTNDAV